MPASPAAPAPPSAAVRSLRLALALLALSGALTAAIEGALLWQDEWPAWLVSLYPAVGLLYIGAGVLAWSRRPSNRTGALLCATGLGILLAAVANLEPPGVLYALAVAAAELPIGMVLHLLVAFPSGRIPDRRGRALVAAGYVATVGLQLPQLFSDYDNPSGPESLELAERLQSALAATVIALTSVWLLRRLRAAEPARRRVLAALWLYGIFTLLFLVLSAEVVRPLLGLDPYQLFALQLAVFAGVPVAFVTGVLRGGFARTGEVVELGARLAGEHDRASLRDALATTLGDPSLELLFWLGPGRGYVDAGSRPAALPSAGSERAAQPVTVAGRPVGAIVYDAALVADAELVRAAAQVIALVLDRERLTVELLAHRRALSESRARLVAAGDAERRRLARDLHDGLQGRLVLLVLRAGTLAALPGGGPEAARLRDGLDEAIAELRRLLDGVLPGLLLERGLFAAVEDLADRMPLPTRVELPASGERLAPALESTAYFAVAEALTNAVKHAGARTLQVRAALDDGRLTLEVADDGAGGARLGGGSGLRGIADRIDVAGGTLALDSPPGAGTRVRVELPVRAAGAALVGVP